MIVIELKRPERAGWHRVPREDTDYGDVWQGPGGQLQMIEKGKQFQVWTARADWNSWVRGPSHRMVAADLGLNDDGTLSP